MHAAHRSAEYQPQVVNAEPFFKHLMLGRNHVVVVILGKPSVQSIAGFTGFAMADAIVKNNEVAVNIEQLPGTKNYICKLWLKKLPSGSPGTVKDEDSVGDASLRIANRLAECQIMQAQLG